MIPSMIGFVNEAKKKAAIAEQREIYVAAQAISTEYFAKDSANALTKLGIASASATGVEATSLGSAAVVAARSALAANPPVQANIDAIKDATKAMASYVDTDIHAGDGTTNATTGGALWTVFISDKGIVKKVTYQKDGVKLDDLVPSASMK